MKKPVWKWETAQENNRIAASKVEFLSLDLINWTGVMQGSEKNYNASLESCDCPDFVIKKHGKNHICGNRRKIKWDFPLT